MLIEPIIAHRRALEEREDAVALALARSFAQIADALEPALTTLTQTLTEAGATATPTWLRRQKDYQHLLADANAAYLAYGRQATTAIAAQHDAALAHGQRDAGALLTTSGVPPKPLTKRRQGDLQVAMRRRLRAMRLPQSIAQLAVATLRETLGTAVRGLLALPTLITKAREGLGQILVNVLRAARTEATTAYRAVVVAQFAATPGVTGWQWAAELDKTPWPCAVCVAMHGQTFAADAPFGAHIGCRCLALPVRDGVRPPIGEHGIAWFARQPEAAQRAVLGKAKQRLYAAGELRLEQLVEVSDHPIYGVTRHERSLKTLGLDYRTVVAPVVPAGSA